MRTRSGCALARAAAAAIGSRRVAGGGRDELSAPERDVTRTSATPEPDVLTVSEAATFLRIGRNQLYAAIGRNEIPHRRVGRSIRLSRAAVLRGLEAAR